MSAIEIITLNSQNIEQYKYACFLNAKNPGAQKKLEWLKERFSEGLQIKLLYADKGKKCIGFLEYIPGEYAWRAVDAKGYLFIHCIWVSPNAYKEKGYGSLLIAECLADAKKLGMHGAAVMTSTGAFMADSGLFLKAGFQSAAQANPGFDLLVKSIRKGPLPKFRDWQKQLAGLKGLHILYSNQCPWVARFMEESTELLKQKGLKPKITEFRTAVQAQKAPSPYGVFNLVYNGKLFADHYISATRFHNILKKEMKLL